MQCYTSFFLFKYFLKDLIYSIFNDDLFLSFRIIYICGCTMSMKSDETLKKYKK